VPEKRLRVLSVLGRPLVRLYKTSLRRYFCRRLVAYSPRMGSIHGLPNETHDECCEGHDEGYVFDKEAPVSEMEVFVNWEGFRLYDPQSKWWVDHLFEQMARLGAESNISDGTVFTFATRNPDLFARVLAAFRANNPASFKAHFVYFHGRAARAHGRPQAGMSILLGSLSTAISSRGRALDGFSPPL
jgi:hypothetical protein